MTRNRDIADFNPGFYSGKNLLINGCLSEYQRGVSGTGTYVADRWRQEGVSATSKNTANTPKGYLQGHYISRDVTGRMFFGQRIEAAISAQTAGEDVTFSFELYDVTGIDSLEVVAYHTSAKDDWSTQSILFYVEALADLTDGRKVVTIPCLPEIVKHGLYIGLKARVSSSGSYKVTGLQLELGDEATRFVPDLPSVNLAKCQRYAIQLSHQYFTTYHGVNNGMTHWMFDMRSVPSVSGVVSGAIHYVSTKTLRLISTGYNSGGHATPAFVDAEL